MLEFLNPVPEGIKHPKSVSPSRWQAIKYLVGEKFHEMRFSAQPELVINAMATAPLVIQTPAAIIETFNAAPVEAAPLEQNITRPRPWTGGERNWRPLSAQTAASHPGTSPLHEIGGPLHIYDIAHERFFGWGTDARGWEEADVARWLDLNPNRVIDAGYCRELAIIALLENTPNDFLAPEIADLPNIRQNLRDIKVGLLIAMHASDPKLRFASDAVGISQILRAFPSNPVIVESPDNWFRPVYELDSNSFLGTNFGFADVRLGRGTIVTAQIPQYIPYYYGRPLGGSQRMQAESRTNSHINEHLNHSFIRYLVYGEQYVDPTS